MKNTLNAFSTLYHILPRSLRLKVILTGVNSFLMIGLDLLGVGLLLPLLVMVLGENNIDENPYLHTLYQHTGFESTATFIHFVLIVVVCIALIRLLLTSYISYRQSRMLFDISQFLSLRLYRIYYSNGFMFVKQNNSHRLINKIEGVAAYLIQGYFIPFVGLISELVVTLIVLGALMVYNIQVFGLVVVTFAPISILYYHFTQKRIRRYGERLFELYPRKNQLLQQTFVGFGDMALSGMFDESARQYESLLHQQGVLIARKGVLHSSLQRVLEFTVVCAVVVLVAAAQYLSLSSLSIAVGLFAIAIYRVMPGVVKSTNAIFAMRSNSFALELLDEIKADDEKVKTKSQYEPIVFHDNIEFSEISFSYEEGKPILTDLSLAINKGDFIGIKGESGSGKSTLFYLLLGFISSQKGKITVDGQLLDERFKDNWRSQIGYVSQQLFMINGSLQDNVVMGGNVDTQRLERVLRLASLEDFVATLPDGPLTQVGEGGSKLSGGQRQRIGIARALYRDVELLLLDEATSSLDEDTQLAINEALQHLKEQCSSLTIIVISHRSEALAVCDKVVDIEELSAKGRIQPL